MSRTRPRRKRAANEIQAEPPVLNPQSEALSSDFDDNIKRLSAYFDHDNTFITRTVSSHFFPQGKLMLMYCKGMADCTLINNDLLEPLMRLEKTLSNQNVLDDLLERVVWIHDLEKTGNIDHIIDALTFGDSLLMVPGCDEVLIFATKNFITRAIQEPDSEKVLTGPRDGFCESLPMNTNLLRRRLRTSDLKMELSMLGTRSKTQICVCYLDSIVNKGLLNELKRRLEHIDIDAILDSNYITELIRDSALSPFRATGYSERPDVVASKILEGRIAIIVDGTPVVITVPYLFIENFQSNEDYYFSYYYASFARLLRILGFFLTIAVPAFYIAIVAFHHEMLPSPLLINIASERHSVPLPAAIEAVIMLLTFDILKETGVRMPSNVGQALSIVGALVIGQAAVEAKLVAAPMIIIVALTGITSLLIPKMNAPVIFLRFLLLFLASILGFYGLTLGLCGILVHILNLHSLGIPQLTPTGHMNFQDVKDTFIRAPMWLMRTRTNRITHGQNRMSTGGRPHA